MIVVLGYDNYEGPQYIGAYSNKEVAIKFIERKYASCIVIYNKDYGPPDCNVYTKTEEGKPKVKIAEFEFVEAQIDSNIMSLKHD